MYNQLTVCSKVSLKTLKIVKLKVRNINLNVRTKRGLMSGPYPIYNKRIGIHMNYFKYDQKA
jgi:hypothetical protein